MECLPLLLAGMATSTPCGNEQRQQGEGQGRVTGGCVGPQPGRHGGAAPWGATPCRARRRFRHGCALIQTCCCCLLFPHCSLRDGCTKHARVRQLRRTAVPLSCCGAFVLPAASLRCACSSHHPRRPAAPAAKAAHASAALPPALLSCKPARPPALHLPHPTPTLSVTKRRALQACTTAPLSLTARSESVSQKAMTGMFM